ncbi:MAG: hypothetical protein MJK13_12570, partial [Pseudomonadales bacterium]|nr:hypothetical protein [Pseudomonadales bacterium]
EDGPSRVPLDRAQHRLSDGARDPDRCRRGRIGARQPPVAKAIVANITNTIDIRHLLNLTEPNAFTAFTEKNGESAKQRPAARAAS